MKAKAQRPAASVLPTALAFIALTMSVFSPYPASAETLVIAPSADTYVDASNPDQNYADDSRLRTDAAPERIIFLRFQVSGVNGRPVERARLRLSASSGSAETGGSLHVVPGGSWSESSLTFSNRPSFSASSIDVLGPVASGSVAELVLDEIIVGDGTYDLAITSDSNDGISYDSTAATSAQPPELWVTVGDSAAPAVEILQPSDGATFFEGDTVPLHASVTDDVDTGLEALLAWRSDRDGPLATGATTSATLSEGGHVLTASVTDGDGHTGSDQVGITIVRAPDQNTEPLVAITSPLDGGIYGLEETIAFEGTATDLEDGSLSQELGWTSNRDGSLGTGPSLAARLSAGTHQVTAVATDAGGLTGSATVRIDVVPGTVLVVPAVADAYVDENYPNSALGTDTLLRVDANAERIAYLRFALTGMAGRSIERAVLRLNVTDVSGAEGESGGALHAMASGAWDEETLTYATRPPIGSQILEPLGPVSRGEIVELDLTAVIDGEGVYDFALVGASNDAVTYDSREAAAGGPALVVFLGEDNAPPDIEILAPTPGTKVNLGSSVTLDGRATDDEDGDLSGSIAWRSDLQGSLGSGSRLTVTLAGGDHTITASVTDDDGAEAHTTTDVAVGNPPNVTIQSPEDGAVVSSSYSVSFRGDAKDKEDGSLRNYIRWSSNLDGYLATGRRVRARLSAGTHSITASVTDSDRITGKAVITVRALGPNAAPDVTITSPADGLEVAPGSYVDLLASAVDDTDGDLSDAISWTSDQDGNLGTGSYTRTRLSEGDHRITASARDSNGATGLDTVNLVVTPVAPAVTILDPPDGLSVPAGTVVRFLGIATDPTDGDLSEAIVWTSDRSGRLGTGGSISTSSLPEGTHRITASVSDAGGLTATDRVTIVIEPPPPPSEPPVVSILAPVDGALVALGQPIHFIAAAQDPESGDVSGMIRWSSNRDGALGTGAELFVDSLRQGTHRITATASDPEGVTGTASIDLEIVDGVPAVTILLPTPDSGFLTTTSVRFFATATDSIDGDIGDFLTWTSDRQGPIGTGRTLAVSDLDVGEHLITALASNSLGATGTAQVRIVVAPPVVSIPAVADAYVDGGLPDQSFGAEDDLMADAGPSIREAYLRFEVPGFDELDLLSARLELEVTSKGNSDSGGLLHALSGAWAENDVTFTTRPTVTGAPIASAEHAVDAGDVVSLDVTSFVQGEGVYDFALITPSDDAVRYHSREASSGGPAIRLALGQPPVEDIPSLQILGPASDTVIFDDTPIDFLATASDPQDGDLTNAVAWSSSLDGSLGTGGSMRRQLSRGVHVISASVVDSFGLPAKASITLTVIDRPPDLSIVSPLNGALFPLGFPIVFEGSANDDLDGDLSGAIVWTSHRAGPIGTGKSIATATLSAGDHVVTAEVTNSVGTRSSGEVTVFVGQAPPEVRIASPADGTVLPEGAETILTASAQDLEDGDLSGSIRWSSDLEGPLGNGGALPVSLMANGTHQIVAAATDSHGFTRTDAIRVDVVPAPPAITIISPADGADVVGPIGFSGAAVDALDGDLSSSLEWFSSLEGPLGTGAVLPSRQLSPGMHTITARASDSGGLVGEQTATIIVGVALPNVLITEPVSSAGPLSQTAVEVGTDVTFSASAIDSAGGDLSAATTWRSDLNGVLGSGASITVSNLIRGRHVIRADVTDATGVTGSAQIGVLVTDSAGVGAPEVTILSPTEGATASVGDPLALQALAMAGGQDLSSGLIWLSSLDGLLGSGASVDAELRSVGIHAITASVANETGAVGLATVSVDVRAPTLHFEAIADSHTDEAAADTNFGTSDELLVGMAPDRSGYLRFQVTGVDAMPIERAFVRLQAASHAEASSDQGGTIHAIASDSWNESTITHSNHPTIDADALDTVGAVVPSQAIELDVTTAIDGDGVYDFALVPVSVDVAIYRSREAAVGRPELIVVLEAPVSQHPTVSILEPQNQAAVTAGAPALFRGRADDAQDGNIDPAIIWASNVNGRFALGPEVMTQLSPGPHVITARANDTNGNQGADAIHVFVGNSPVVVIDAPADNATVPFGEPLVLGGTAFDPQDGDLAEFLEWSSDLDGPLAVGPSAAPGLTPGTHMITASATDADGNTGRAMVSVTVTADNVGFKDFDFSNADQDNNRITASKPESKLWHIDGTWWATLYSPAAGAYTMHRLDLLTQSWINTGVFVDERAHSRQDTLLLGNKLYVLSRMTLPPGQNRLLRYTYHAEVQAFLLDPGYPVDVPGGGTESMTLAKDTTGRLWAAYTLADRVMVTHTTTSESEWAEPFVVPISDEDPNAATIYFDDIAAVQALNGSIGVFWSNQLTREDYFAVHRDGTAPADPASWSLEVAATGGSIADDHFNMKLAEDGRLFVAVKTSFNAADNTLVGLLVRTPNGIWSPLYNVTKGRFNPTRPLCMLDESRRRVHVFYSPFEGAIFTKSSDMDLIAFPDPEGVGTPFITSSTTGVINNPTSTKQNVDATTGLVVLAASKSFYWHNAIEPEPVPEVSILQPSSGTTVPPGTPVTFAATAFSLRDGLLTDSLEWQSDLDGPLGTGGSITRSDLSIGAHEITASVSDSAFIPGSDSIVVAVEEDGPPIITIDSPASGANVLVGSLVTFSATAIDAMDGDVSNTLVWTSDRDGVLGQGPVLATDSLSEGLHGIDAEATDAGGLVGRAVVVLDVQAPAPPVVDIRAPADGDSLTFGAAALFEATGLDAFDGDLTGSLRWSSDRDGALGTGGGFSRTTLSIGEHAITAAVTDSHGLEGSQTVGVTVTEGTRVTITSPPDDSHFAEGQSVSFSGTAIAIDGANLTSSLEWSSSLDGSLGGGGSIVVDDLSAGDHVVTATASDPSGQSYSAQVHLTVEPNAGPSVGIEGPASGQLLLSDSPVAFAARASDPEDGDLGPQIEWSSSIDGVLGTGNVLLSAGLSAGTHQVMARVRDSLGAEATAALTLDVRDSVQTVTAEADTYVDSGQPDAVLGDESTFRIDASPTREAFVRFSVPAQDLFAVGRVDLVLTVGPESNHAGNSGGRVHSMTDTSWSEETMTFTTRPAIDGPLLASLGAVQSGDTVSIDVSDVVSGPGLYAFGLASDSSDGVGYRSRESGSNAPTLALRLTQDLPPVVVITQPTTQTVLAAGATVTLAAQAVDPEDGSLGSLITWSSSLQGFLGTGASIDVALIPGSHQITATVSDGAGQSAQSTIDLEMSDG